MMLRVVLLGMVVSTVIALVARRARSLSGSGAVAAIALGTMATIAGVQWAQLLIGYFIVSTLISRLGRAAKEQRTASVVDKGGRRDATQVLANGGVFATCAVVSSMCAGEAGLLLAVAALGALAASTADTWATEIGTLYGASPRAILGFSAVPPGTSGGVSLAGTLGMVAGAVALAAAARELGLYSTMLGVAGAGVAGALADSLLGATLQERRRCPRCDQPTERSVHSCGTPTSYAGGLEWLDNDRVNLAATITGAMVAAALHVA